MGDKGGYRQISKTLNACAFEDYLSTQRARLPKLEDVDQISPRVIRVLGQNAGKVGKRYLYMSDSASVVDSASSSHCKARIPTLWGQARRGSSSIPAKVSLNGQI